MADVLNIINHQNGHISVGKIEGTGAAIAVNLGFKPYYVKLVDITQKAISEFFFDMTAAHAIQTVDSGTGTTDIAEISSNGITLSATGFTIGTDSKMNTDDDVVYYIAIG